MLQDASSGKIEVMGGKSSELYRDWINDFSEERYFMWQSIWFQAREVLSRQDVFSVLEFGSGHNLTKAIVEHFGIRHLSVDVNERFGPDIVSSIDKFSSEKEV